MTPKEGSKDRRRLSSGMKVKKRSVMEEVVEDVEEYEALHEPGVLQSDHLGPNIELYLFTLPTAILDPMKLINCEMTLNSVKDRKVRVGDQKYSIVNYPTSDDLPPLYLPSEDGVLSRKGANVIKSHVVLRGQAQVQQENDGGADEGTRSKGYIDLDSLRSTTHLPPSDIQPRDFLANGRKIASPVKATITEKKAQKKRKREVDDGEEILSPKVKKRKWEIHGKKLLTSPSSPQTRKPEGYDDDNTGSPVHLTKNKKTTNTDKQTTSTTPNAAEQRRSMTLQREEPVATPCKVNIKKEMEAALSTSQNTTTADDDVETKKKKKKKKKKSDKRNSDSYDNPSIAVKKEN